MPTIPQDNFLIEAKKRLIERGLTVTALARQIGKARNTTSMAINHPVYPTVRKLIAKELGMEESA